MKKKPVTHPDGSERSRLQQEERREQESDRRWTCIITLGDQGSLSPGDISAAGPRVAHRLLHKKTSGNRRCKLPLQPLVH